jgi:hypothetical protein
MDSPLNILEYENRWEYETAGNMKTAGNLNPPGNIKPPGIQKPPGTVKKIRLILAAIIKKRLKICQKGIFSLRCCQERLPEGDPGKGAPGQEPRELKLQQPPVIPPIR